MKGSDDRKRGDKPSALARGVRQQIGARVAPPAADSEFRELFDLAPVGYLALTADGQITRANSAAAAMLGQPKALLTGCAVQMLVCNEDRALLARYLLALRAGEPAGLELRMLHSDGRQLPVSVRSVAAVNQTDSARTINMVLVDISGHKQAETELRAARDHLDHLAHHDPLTDLPNRLLFSDRLHQAALRARRRLGKLALLFIDVDRFKFINDSLGHQVGDEFLCEMAYRIRSCVRAVDTVARIGGDEFTVVLERIEHREHALEVAAKIREALRAPVDLNGHRVFVTSSIGVALFPDDAEDSSDLIRYADAAMFAAKEQGRDRLQCFGPAMRARLWNRIRVESELRQAVSQRQLRLHYQPQFSGRGYEVVGFEALLRWDHPAQGLLMPSDFIHVAEDSNLIQELGGWVLVEACKQARLWHNLGHPVRLAVNVSTRQLGQPGFADELAAILAESGLAPEALELEITESTLMVDPEPTVECLRQVRAAGVQVAIDDFGTGFSSLSRLRRLPISRLKIDRSFVHGIPHSQDDRAIALAIISMAHDLSLEVVSEGVETEAQRDFLSASGSDLLQGFALARPRAAAEATSWLRSRCAG